MLPGRAKARFTESTDLDAGQLGHYEKAYLLRHRYGRRRWKEARHVLLLVGARREVELAFFLPPCTHALHRPVGRRERERERLTD